MISKPPMPSIPFGPHRALLATEVLELFKQLQEQDKAAILRCMRALAKAYPNEHV